MTSLFVALVLITAAPTLALSQGKEDGKCVLVATVTEANKPVENATVAFSVPRTFGSLSLGKESTIDDGTAAVPCPANLPGGATGRFEVVARVVAPAASAGTEGRIAIEGAPTAPRTNPFPRELWSPRAPLGLVVSIALLVLGVWITYFTVARELFRIRKGASS